MNIYTENYRSSLSIYGHMILLLVLILAIIGIFMQYSAGNGIFRVYSYTHTVKFLIGLVLLIIVYRYNLNTLYKLLLPFFLCSLGLLIFLILIKALSQAGVQRWINFGIFVMQPSELMKLAVILIIAKHFHNCNFSKESLLKLYVYPIILVLLPFALIAAQPDLGTAFILLAICIGLLFIAGLKIRYFIIMTLVFLSSIPILWSNMQSYQQARVLSFIDPTHDPLGKGYQAIQSKIAIGSGGLFGKGLLNGTQSQLDFLPEKHTDFIFTLLSEEFGFLGGLVVILLFFALIVCINIIAYKCTYRFGKIVAAGIALMIFCYVFVNIAMVSGLLPTVGVPLPMISFGGTSMVTMMVGIGLVLNIDTTKSLKKN